MFVSDVFLLLWRFFFFIWLFNIKVSNCGGLFLSTAHNENMQKIRQFIYFLLVVYEMIWDRREGPATAAADTNSLAVMICFSFVFVFNSSYVIDYLFPFLFLMLNLLASQSREKILPKLHVDWWNFFCWRNSNCYFETLFENSFCVVDVVVVVVFQCNNSMCVCCVFFDCACECETKIKTKFVMYPHWHVSRCERGNNQQTTELVSVHAQTIDVDG